MRLICWLHVSDIHLTVRDAWSQDVVLRARCEHIISLRADGMVPDFVLMSGDPAFSGRPHIKGRPNQALQQTVGQDSFVPLDVRHGTVPHVQGLMANAGNPSASAGGTRARP
jgi:hypothetical protein